MKNPLLCRKVINRIDGEDEDSRLVAEKEKAGEWEVRRYSGCFITFVKINESLVLGVLVFDRFNRSTVRAMEDATKSRNEQIVAITKDKRVARILSKIGYKVISMINGEFEMRSQNVR